MTVLKIIWFVLIGAGIAINLSEIFKGIVKWIKKNVVHRTVRLPEVEPKFDEKGFVWFCYEALPRGRRIENTKAELMKLSDRAEALAKKLQETQTELMHGHTPEDQNALRDLQKSLTGDIRETQAQLSRGRARLNSLEECEDTEPDDYSREQALNDFVQIKTMRGVHQVYIDGNDLKIYVRVSYQYRGFLYDLGDYLISINMDGEFTAMRCRGTRGGYGSYGFCFGERYYEIKRYSEGGRIVEAVELMIECLNYINRDDRKNIVEDYRAIRRLSRDERKG